VKRNIAVISDFDGTIARRDVGHHFFGQFVPERDKWEKLLEDWKLGLISSRECLEHEVDWIKAGRRDLDEFIKHENLDPYFKDFVDFCNRRRFEFMILSDGLDYYIERLLMRFGVGFLDFKANHLVLNNGSITGVAFPYFNAMDCTMCGNCKLYHLEELKERDFYTVYIGNGFSDRCAAEHADLVLAKADLLDHCRREGIDCIPFANFRDVEREITSRLILSE
jgi:2-hydroxy-3-keto-5-methylthiopentenyl-1-phosphate phosphatase